MERWPLRSPIGRHDLWLRVEELPQPSRSVPQARASSGRPASLAEAVAMLEAAMDKRRIFEIYLNVAEWGENVFGAEAAARHYFGVDAAHLSLSQAATLAALPRSPP